jgi:ankyrin repeat protein
VYSGHYEVAKLLLEKGAYPSPEVESSADALSIAPMNKDDKMVELLCSYGSTRNVGLLAHYGDLKTAAAVFAANPALADDPGALSSAVGNGNQAFARLILRYQPDLPKRITVDGAATRELTELLFEHGMNPSQPNWLGVTPLHRMARKGDVGNAALYVDHGADLHARDEDICSTPLGWAAKAGKIQMVEFLLRRGVRPTLPDDPPWATPLAWATRRGHTAVVDLLKQYDRTVEVPRAGIGSYVVLARDMIAAYNLGDAEALERLNTYFEREHRSNLDQFRARVREFLGRPSAAEEGSDSLALDEAQFLIARSHGFVGWAELVEYIDE